MTSEKGSFGQKKRKIKSEKERKRNGRTYPMLHLLSFSLFSRSVQFSKCLFWPLQTDEIIGSFHRGIEYFPPSRYIFFFGIQESFQIKKIFGTHLQVGTWRKENEIVYSCEPKKLFSLREEMLLSNWLYLTATPLEILSQRA